MNLKFFGEEREDHIRVYMMVGGLHYFCDVALYDGSVEMRSAELFEDKSVLAVKPPEEGDPQLERRQDILKNLINDQL